MMMQLLGISKVTKIPLLFALPLFAMQAGPGQKKSNTSPTGAGAVVTVDVPLQEFLNGALVWLAHHPEAIPKARPLIPAPSQGGLHSGHEDAPGPAPMTIKMPSLDLYSPAGVSIYHSEDQQKNPAFIRALPGSIQQAKDAKTDEIRPTLQEAIEMLAELKPYEAAIMARKQVTIFALTYPADTARCGAQDQAIQQLKERAQRIGIRVIEVRLHK